MFDLNDPITANELNRIVRKAVQAELDERLPLFEYGIVSAVAGGKATVLLAKSAAIATPNIPYAPADPPRVGDRVRVVTLPSKDRYIDDNLTKTDKVAAVSFEYGSITSVPDITWTNLAAWTANLNNLAGLSTTGQFTVPLSGVYRFTVQASLAAHASGSRGLGLGLGGAAPDEYSHILAPAVATAGFPTRTSYTRTMPCTAGQVWRPMAYQNSGVSLATGGSTFIVEFLGTL